MYVSLRISRGGVVAIAMAAVMTATLPGVAMDVDLTATDSGFLTAEGGASKFDGTITSASFNYSVGYEAAADGGGMRFNIPFVFAEKKNYFVFDFAGVGGPITAATLKLEMPTLGYDSGDLTETYVLSGTSATPGELGMLGMLDILTEWYELDGAAASGLAGTPMPSGIATDNPFVVGSAIDTGTAEGVDVKPGTIGLAAGLFGVLTEAYDGDPGTALSTAILGAPGGSPVIVEMDFTPAGIDYLNAVLPSGTVVIGGKLTSLVAVSGSTEEIFGFSDSPGTSPTLSLTFVPEPSVLAVFGLTTVGLGLRRPRRR